LFKFLFFDMLLEAKNTRLYDFVLYVVFLETWQLPTTFDLTDTRRTETIFISASTAVCATLGL